MELSLGLFLGVIVFIAFLLWARRPRSRDDKKAGSPTYDGTGTSDPFVPDSHHAESSCHGGSADAGGSSDACSTDSGGSDGGGSDGGSSF